MDKIKNIEGMTFAIGDLHGRFDLLKMAIEKAEEICGDKNGTFVVCGDFIDRGPESRQIIEHLMKGPDKPNWTWVTIMGNHEDMMLQCIQRRQFNWWVGNGGNTTLLSYGYKNGDNFEPMKIPEEHIRWLSKLPVYYLDEHRAFVHAGFNEAKPLSEQSTEYMMWRYDGAKREDQPNYSFEGKHVVHGHVQHADGPILLSDTSNIDTFAWLHGKLALACFDNMKAGGPDIVMIEGKPDKRYITLDDEYDEG